MKHEENIYDFLIYYSASDKEWAEGVLRVNLETMGLNCLSPTDFKLGHLRVDELEKAIVSSRRVLLILSPEYLNDNDLSNILFASMVSQHGAAVGAWPLIPVLKEKVPLPLQLQVLVGLEFSDSESLEHSFKRLLDTASLPVKAIPETKKIAAPYPGLRAFDEEESAYFFGRNKDIRSLTYSLEKNGFVAVIGASGSGKSSLVKAGLIPHIKNHKSEIDPDSCEFLSVMRPSEEPLKQFRNILGEFDLEMVVSAVERYLTMQEKQTLLILLDQFEEVFSLPEKDQATLIDVLVALAANQNVYLIITIRDDFYHQIMATPLRGWIKKDRFDVDFMNEEGLREAITGPALTKGVFIDRLLVEKLVSDAGKEPGILPFLQEAMRRLWRDGRRYNYMPADAYQTLILDKPNGEVVTGLRAAIAQHCEEVFGQLSDSQQGIAHCMLIRLVQVGDGVPSTRLRLSFDQLKACGSEEEFREVLRLLSSKNFRLLTLNKESVDIAHEALITAWLCEKDWFIRDIDAELTRRKLFEDAIEWSASLEQSDTLSPRKIKSNNKLIKQLSQHHSLSVDQVIIDHQAASIKANKRRLLWVSGYFAISIILLYSLSLAYSYMASKGAISKITQPSNIVSFKSGDYVIGLSEAHEIDDPTARPERVFSRPGFSIDKYEVSNEKYCSCVTHGACESVSYNSEKVCNSQKNLPVHSVNIAQAFSYCAWLGGRLPHEVEWEHAAREYTERIHPNPQATIDNKYLNIGYGELLAVNEMPFDITPGGVVGLGGNIREWVMSQALKYDDEAYTAFVIESVKELGEFGITRGGGWKDDFDYSYIQRRDRTDVYFKSDDIGFRCVYD